MLYYTILTLFLAAAALNLAGTRTKRNLLFAITKPMLLSLLCVYCILRTYPETNTLLAAALCACFVGDVLLMLPGTGWFVAGGLSFFAGHVLLIVTFAGRADFMSTPLWISIPAAALYVAAACAVMARCRKDVPITMKIPLSLYLLCNSATNLFALAHLVCAPGIWQAAAFVGAALFFISDSALFLRRFAKERESFFTTNFFVMLTYICGVFLITLGLTGA